MRLRTALALALGGFAAAAACAQGETLPNFRLLDTQGVSHEMHRLKDKTAVVIVACPVDGPLFDAIMAQLAALPPTMAAFVLDPTPAWRAPLDPAPPAPVLMDPSQAVTRALGFGLAGEALEASPVDWTIDARSALPHLPSVSLALAGGPVPPVLERVELDLIPTAPSYALDVAPILKAKCATCHRPGDIGPFALTSHHKARGWSKMIEEAVLTGRMPPWHADPRTGRFANDCSLTPEETRTIAAWVRAGAPDDPALPDPLAEVQPRSGEWRLGAPDAAIEMPQPFEVPAEGVLDYQLVTIPSGFTEDRWIRGVEVLPGNPAVLHHALVFVEYPAALKHLEPRVRGGASGFFAGFVPGAAPEFFPEGTGKFVPAGASFIFQMHYVPNGAAAQDRTRLGLHFCSAPPGKLFVTDGVFNASFEIAPRSVLEVEAQDDIRLDAAIYAFTPHMHLRGSTFRYWAQYPDGRTEPLLSVPDYRFAWQTNYRLAEPLAVPAGTVIRCAERFDNTAANPFNPDPDAAVHFGDQTYEEMFIGYVHYAVDPAAWRARMERRRALMQQDRQDFQSAAPPEAAGPPMTPDQLIGTLWEEGEFKFRFLAGGQFLVNELIKGAYRVENNRVYIDVVGEHFELDIIGQGLYFNGSYAIRRLE